ncbi:MAG: hypothetical protein DI587_38160 [Variovorax paradoxus]|nr:MAG: hypothetical protein DI583_38160 [Variovorax paradoxus]PZP99644.1 MAG: hypothetical protein DI587_38160 [Variovorax paradoxus]
MEISAGLAFVAGSFPAQRREHFPQITSSLAKEVAWEFLGIYSGRINAESDLGMVWHADFLTALVDAAESDYLTRAAARSRS